MLGLAEEASLHDQTSVERPSLSAERCCCGWHEPPGGRGSVRRCGIHCGEVGAALARYGHRRAASAGWRQTLRPDRGPRRGDPRADCCKARHHAGGDRQPVGAAAWPEVCVEHGLALLRPPWSDVQKKPRTRASRNGRTWPRKDKPGAPHSPNSTHGGSCSSMRLVPRPKWPGFAAGRCVAAVAWPRSRTAIGRRQRSSAACGSAG